METLLGLLRGFASVIWEAGGALAVLLVSVWVLKVVVEGIERFLKKGSRLG